MQSYELDCVVIGAGVIGLAVARAMAQAGREVIVVERAATIGTETSSRSSEVIHAGIYYPTHSLKAKMCLDGREALYRYCISHGIGHRRTGKLIVATDDSQLGELEALAAKAKANGVDDMVTLSAPAALSLEPALTCVAALLSPSTGIIDSHGLMLAYQGEAEDAGARFAFKTEVTGGTVTPHGIELSIEADEPFRITARSVVNAAGLFGPALAGRIEGLPAEHVPRAYFAKGNYFTLAGRAPFQRLIYPVPEPGGLGVHLTLDLGGQARFGPDVEWVERIDYAVDPARSQRFYGAVRRYWPHLADGALVPAYAGIRPKIAPPDVVADFVIQGPEIHGVAGLVNLFGIESPGLTASLAIADAVRRLLAET